jgi:hypothetical protein
MTSADIMQNLNRKYNETSEKMSTFPACRWKSLSRAAWQPPAKALVGSTATRKE